MGIAIKEAQKGITLNDGGPFGAVISRKGKIISQGHNEVLKMNDPTCHAEIVAIRKACKKLKRFGLSDCEIYSTCEPCPMCFAAIRWAKIQKLSFGCTRKDAAKIGFDDEFIYDLIKGEKKDKKFKIIKTNRKNCLVPFKNWELKENKKLY